MPINEKMAPARDVKNAEAGRAVLRQGDGSIRFDHLYLPESPEFDDRQ
jgi:hypothetical protein